MSKNSKSNELARSTAAKHRGGIPALDGLRTESDVEQKLIYRVLTAPEWLGISAENIHTKEYLQPKDLDKGRKLKRGYFPDYSIWFDGLPVMIVEAKSPDEDVYEGLREARLYALEMNKQYPTEVNPIEIICASNGSILVYSFWDSDDFQSIAHDQLVPGTRKAEQFRDFCSKSTMMRRVEIINSTAIEKDTFIGSDFLGGQKLLRQRIGFNSFAEPLSPLIKMYFDSESPARFEEIVTLGYVHTDDTTRYHRTLETFLRDKISSIGGAPIKEIQTRKQGEIDLTHKITDAISSDDFFGELQLIIGPVGAGKTIFLHRYFQHLIPRDLRERVAYIYINFNQAPDDLTNLENWLCESFLEVVDKKILNGQLYHIDNLRRIFAPNIRRRDIGVYSHLKKKTPDEYEKKISEDLRIWTEDWQEFAFSTCRFLSGDKGVPIVVAFDNVDRRNRDQQLKIFQTAQWFKAKSRALCLLTLRDETFERYKEEPPLDAFLTSVNFYIQPPRFVDVVRNRLSLALGNLSANAEKRQTFALPNGMYVTYPATELGEYLTAIYVTLFQRRRQITGVLEALSGKNVRRALSMFADILVSKHLSEVIIAKAIKNFDEFVISESTIIKVLMRTVYRLYQDSNGYITNIFDSHTHWKKPSNFLYIEILSFLVENRKKRGDVGMEGYFFIGTIQSELEKLGFLPEDIASACQYLLDRNLVVCDSQDKKDLVSDDLLRVHASGYIHVKFLARRLEYLSGVACVTHVTNKGIAEKLSSFWDFSFEEDDISHYRKKRCLEELIDFLKREYVAEGQRNPYFFQFASASSSIISGMERTLEWKGEKRSKGPSRVVQKLI